MDKFINSLIIVVVACIVLALITKLLVIFLPIILIAVAVIWIYKMIKNKTKSVRNDNDVEYDITSHNEDVDNNAEVIDVDYKDVE